METNAAAIEALIENYGKLVFHVIYGLTGDWHESEDLTQETYLQAFRGIGAARAKAGPAFQAKAWLLRIAVNTVRMQRRWQRALRFFTFSELQAGRGTAEHTAEGRTGAYEEIEDESNLETVIAERDTVQRCMEQLPETLRLPLLLSIVVGFSPSEIASMLALKEAAVRQRLSRARKSFQSLSREACGERISLGGTVSPAVTRVSLPRGRPLHRSAALAPASL